MHNRQDKGVDPMSLGGILDRPHQSTPGSGHEAQILKSSLCLFRGTSDQSKPALEGEVFSLLEKWEEETRFSSKIQVDHPSYQKVIRLGYPVVPILLQLMNERPGHWHFALKEICHANPVPRSERGDLSKIRKRWHDWGVVNNYVF